MTTGKTNSIALTEGPSRAAARAMLRGVGFLLATFSLAAATLSAQTVPVPSQFATAKSVFLGAAGAPTGDDRANQMVSMLYEDMYQALASAHLYQMRSAPAQADLSMAVSIEVSAAGTSFATNFIRLSVYDTKTHTLLWNIDEPLQAAFRDKSFQKNVDESTTKIIDNLKQLKAGKVPGNSTSK